MLTRIRAAILIRGSGSIQVQRDELQEFVILHLGQPSLAAAYENLIGDRLFPSEHLVDLFFDRSAADKLVNQDVAFLADPKRAIRRLILHRRIPPAIEVDHVRSGCQVQPRPARFDGDHKEGRAVLLLELADQLLAFATGVPPCSTNPLRPKTVSR